MMIHIAFAKYILIFSQFNLQATLHMLCLLLKLGGAMEHIQ